MAYKHFVGVLIVCFALVSCSKLDIKKEYPKTPQEREDERIGKLTGKGIFLVGGESKHFGSNDVITVNSYLWRAALDNISFMPLNSSDPFGGTIITDWYSLEQNSKERYKVNIFIVGSELRQDILKVNVYKQKLDSNGNWGQQFSDKRLARELKDKIIRRVCTLKAMMENNQ
jgi:hypothetical protein